MDALKNHGPKIILAIVFLGCASFSYMVYSDADAQPAEFKDLDSSLQKISSAVSGKKVSPAYPYGAQAAQNLKYKDYQNAFLERAAKLPEGEIPSHLAYPMPSRPSVDVSKKPLGDDDLTQHLTAELGEISEVKAEGHHGGIFVTFKVPGKLKFMDPVRAEVFRGMAADKIDLATPYATVELGPEELVSAEDTAAAVAEKAAEEPVADTQSSGAKRRAAAAAAEDAKPAKGGKKEVKKVVEEIPVEYANTKVFSDTHVEQKKPYFYKVRLIARMNVVPEKRYEIKEASGILTRIIIYHAPKDAQTAQGKTGSAVLYATKVTETVSATPPSNFEIRLAGTSGKIDPIGTNPFKASKDYKGTFAVRVWVTDAQDWKDKTIEAGPGERLKGSILYKDSETKEMKNYDFDSGYKLIEIKAVEVVTEKTIKVPKIDADGNRVVDPGTKQAVMEERIIKSQPIPSEVALLEELSTGKQEEFPKRADFAARKEAIKYYQALLAQQEKEKKQYKEKMEKLKTRLKEAEATREAERAAKANELGQPVIP